jgi:(E)-4-hydroxy-3-methylbut-2-enyl-diphosphate synthase
VAYEILAALNLRRRGPEIISCPTCGRTSIDLFSIVEQVEEALKTSRVPLKIAIMGCVVNGPGEARDADLGIAGGKGIGILFAKGQVLRKCAEADLVNELLKEIATFEKNA